MYWQAKLPIIIILFVVFMLVCYFGYKTMNEQKETPAKQEDPVATVPQGLPEQITVDDSNAPVLTLKQGGAFTVAEQTGKQPASVPAPADAASSLVIVQPAQQQPTPTNAANPQPTAATAQPAVQPTATAQPAKPAETAPAAPVAATATTTTPAATAQPVQPAQQATQPVQATQTAPAVTQAPAVTIAQLKPAQDFFNQQKYVEARALAQQVIATAAEYSETWMQAAQLISNCNKVFMYSRTACPEKQIYEVKEGDVLVRIAYRQKTTVQAINAMNDKIDARRLYVGRKLSYIPGPWNIKVSKSHFLLTLYRDNQVYRIFKVGIGKENRTPVGIFEIRDKVIDPPWDSPEGRVLPSDPRNILGTRWMGLEAIEGTNPQLTGYGIHGTTLPDTVGTPSSAGCVRLKNEDVEDLYNFIPEPQADKVKVTINE